jgi:ATP/maltotriose-dependent transcriptional regulator MalT
MSDHWDKEENSDWIGASQSDRTDLFIRPRVNKILAKAVKKPLIIVCAGMGYGKTIAVSDFVRDSELPAIWMQLSEFDNIGLSFWENFICAIEHINKSLAEECKDLGFPDTEDKLSQFFMQGNRFMANQRF